MGYFGAVFFGTFVLEDVALATSLLLIQQSKISWVSGFLACFLGITVGDLLLFGLGRLLVGSPKLIKWKKLEKLSSGWRETAKTQPMSVGIFLARMIPGARLPTYVGAGWVGFPLIRFFALTIASVLLWVSMAYLGGGALLAIIRNHWFILLVSVVVLLALIKKFTRVILDPWQRKAFIPSLRKWLYFEFWPPKLFYLPIVPIYAYFSAKHRSLLTPFYIHPYLDNGGIIGESKWELLKYLRSELPESLTTFLLPSGTDAEDADNNYLRPAKLEYPFIVKPDVGQRGFGVRIVRNFADLEDYLKLADFPVIVQKLSLLPKEAGIFYYRKPSDHLGTIFSITDKEFPVVIGDGQNRLGDLILADRRARMIASVYFSRHRSQLDHVLKNGERFLLSECGNHCQGAIFKNGNFLKTDALREKLDSIAKLLPHFYFGRFDIRYASESELKQGKGFEIVEINGAGSEATHIWDAKTSLWEAYSTLFEQWRILFSIADEVKKMRVESRFRVSPIGFLRESARVMFRKTKLDVSS